MSERVLGMVLLHRRTHIRMTHDIHDDRQVAGPLVRYRTEGMAGAIQFRNRHTLPRLIWSSRLGASYAEFDGRSCNGSSVYPLLAKPTSIKDPLRAGQEVPEWPDFAQLPYCGRL